MAEAHLWNEKAESNRNQATDRKQREDLLFQTPNFAFVPVKKVFLWRVKYLHCAAAAAVAGHATLCKPGLAYRLLL